MDAFKSIKAVQKLIDILNQAKERFKHAEIWWRGQRSIDWKLDAGIWRRSDADIAERDIMNQFRRKALSRHAKCPDMWDNVGWLFLMQHYRLQTRLLDWTESLLIATYFAVKKSEKEEEAGALYALSPFQLNAHQFNKKCTFSPDGLTMKPLFDHAFTEKVQKCEKVAAIHSKEVEYDRKISLDINISISYINLIFYTFSDFSFFLNLYFFINISKKYVTN